MVSHCGFWFACLWWLVIMGTFFFFLNCILPFGGHVQNMQDSCIGTHVTVWFAAFLPFTHICHFSPCYPSPAPRPLSLPYPPHRPQCVVLPSLCPCILIVHHPPMSQNMWYFIFCSCVSLLRMMVLLVHPCSYQGHELIVFDCCIIFRGVYVPHFPCPVYHWWAFGLIPGLCYCKQCCNEHSCACVLILEQYIVLWIYTQ